MMESVEEKPYTVLAISLGVDPVRLAHIRGIQ